MYLRVEFQDSDLTYALSRPEILIGSSSEADIQLVHSSISKKHLKVTLDNKTCYVSDLGSTNGSYLDDEQLVPGKKVELNFNQNIRLGTHATLTLLENSQNSFPLPPPKQKPTGPTKNTSTQNAKDKTRIISLTDLKAARASADVKKRKELIRTKAKETARKKKDSSKLFKVLVLGISIIAAAFVSNKIYRERYKKVDKDTIVNKIQGKIKTDEEIEKDLEGFRISRTALISRNKIVDLLVKPKCNQEETSSLCLASDALTKKSNGLIFQKPMNYFFFVSETEWLNKARSIFENSSSAVKEDVQKIALLILLDEIIGIEPEIKGNLYFSLYSANENGIPGLSVVLAIKDSQAKSVSEMFSENKITGNDAELKNTLEELDKYFTFY